MKNNFLELPEGCILFGKGSSNKKVKGWLENWRLNSIDLCSILILSGTKTAEIDGISAAGSTAISRRYTALADAEMLLFGPLKKSEWPLPRLPGGISPALISHVACTIIGLKPKVLVAGLDNQASFPHLCVEDPSNGPSRCISSGHSMSLERVQSLWAKGVSIGSELRVPLLLAESVPGGTTTAQAVLVGLGLSVDQLVSSSLREVPFTLKTNLIKTAFKSAQLGTNPAPQEILSAVGDPFQALCTGILLGAREAGQDVLLGGGSQMLAVLALALAQLKPERRKGFVEGISIGSTSWLAKEVGLDGKSLLALLVDEISEYYGVSLWGISSGLNFSRSNKKVLRDYELGYVKEGVGVGAFSLLAQINGYTQKELIKKCEQAVSLLESKSSSNIGDFTYKD